MSVFASDGSVVTILWEEFLAGREVSVSYRKLYQLFFDNDYELVSVICRHSLRPSVRKRPGRAALRNAPFIRSEMPASDNTHYMASPVTIQPVFPARLEGIRCI